MITTTPGETSPVVRTLLEREATADECFDTLVCFGAHQEAADVFLSAERYGYRVSIKRDGMLENLGGVSRSWGTRLIAYAKVEARLDTAEHRRPQDGRIMVFDGLDPIDVRVSTMPTFFGEDLALRLLDRRNHRFELAVLGLSTRGLGEVLSLIRQPNGLVLVSGATGSGKTTTLYSMLSELNDGTKKINTLEDPVEFDLPGIHQSQINLRIGMDFADLLPSLVRQDPDIIMVGEVRDPATATTVVRAAVTGQLVLGTLHSTRAAGAVHTLLGLGAHPHLLSGALRGVIAQHLLRRTCRECVQSLDATAELSTFEDVEHLLPSGIDPGLYQGRGCEACAMSGYRHRVGLFEILTCSPAVRQLIEKMATPDAIEAQALKEGMIPLRHSAKVAVATGVTTLEEAMRVMDLEA